MNMNSIVFDLIREQAIARNYTRLIGSLTLFASIDKDSPASWPAADDVAYNAGAYIRIARNADARFFRQHTAQLATCLHQLGRCAAKHDSQRDEWLRLYRELKSDPFPNDAQRHASYSLTYAADFDHVIFGVLSSLYALPDNRWREIVLERSEIIQNDTTTFSLPVELGIMRMLHRDAPQEFSEILASANTFQNMELAWLPYDDDEQADKITSQNQRR